MVITHPKMVQSTQKTISIVFSHRDLSFGIEIWWKNEGPKFSIFRPLKVVIPTIPNWPKWPLSKAMPIDSQRVAASNKTNSFWFAAQIKKFHTSKSRKSQKISKIWRPQKPTQNDPNPPKQPPEIVFWPFSTPGTHFQSKKMKNKKVDFWPFSPFGGLTPMGHTHTQGPQPNYPYCVWFRCSSMSSIFIETNQKPKALQMAEKIDFSQNTNS